MCPRVDLCSKSSRRALSSSRSELGQSCRSSKTATAQEVDRLAAPPLHLIWAEHSDLPRAGTQAALKPAPMRCRPLAKRLALELPRCQQIVREGLESIWPCDFSTCFASLNLASHLGECAPKCLYEVATATESRYVHRVAPSCAVVVGLLG